MAMVEENSRGSRIRNVVRIIILFIAALSCFYPLWYTFCNSLSTKSAVEAGYVTFYPIGFTLENYKAITKDVDFYTAFLRSVLRVLIGTPFTLAVCVLIAFPLSKTSKEFRLRNVIMYLLVFCMLFSGGTVPWYLFMIKYKFQDSMVGLVLCGGLPIYYCILIMNSFRSIPKELDEAARIDGASPFGSLLKIILPCTLPTLATIALFVAINYWNDYFQGMILSKYPKSYPLMTYINTFNANIDMNIQMTTEEMISRAKMSNKALNAAKVFIAIVPMLCVYPWIQKYFIKGIMIGAVKG